MWMRKLCAKKGDSSFLVFKIRPEEMRTGAEKGKEVKDVIVTVC
jgi:hypothetical protein